MCDVCGNVPEWLKAPAAEELVVRPKRRPREAALDVDTDLLDFFKEWRRKTSLEAKVPAYIVLSDAALEDLCRKMPGSRDGLLGVSGIGERKAEMYGEAILAAFAEFREGARAPARVASQESPAEETMRLLGAGKSFGEIAEIRGRQLSTVVNCVADLVEKGKLPYRMEWVGQEAHAQTMAAIERLGSQWLKPLREVLPTEISYEQIRLVVALARSEPK
jgi:ATP-dependent DNA helicase RecQ